MDPVLRVNLINLAYLVASVLFILGLKGLTHPRTAVRGNLLSALAMLIAVLATLASQQVLSYWMIAGGLVLGAAIGAVLAVQVQMTAMPQMVALLNGFGGAASLLVAGAELVKYHNLVPQVEPTAIPVAAAVISGIIGSVTFWGSLVAFAKLQELDMFRKPISLPGHQAINVGLAIVMIGLGVWVVLDPPGVMGYWGVCLFASVLGVLLVLPIGGADMPVVIALLNSYSGLAAAATGFVIDNTVLIVAGSLVGASGIILTQIMCKAMNRSIVNVLFGVIDSGGVVGTADEVYQGRVTSTSADEVAMLLDGAERVVVVPGYGLAVAQAQHAVRELADLLEARGVEVVFAIHPVAGRMPGHMNVLLAEAEVPYDKLKEMDEVNPTFPHTDLVLVIGANDVVNPAARTDPDSPIAGMPILNVDLARTVVVIKRSLSPGFAGIPNPLFAADNCLMFFDDGKEAVLALNAAVKEL